jgi:hypothetical protein
MLPDIRFAIGAVLAGALLIVTAFGLAATVRMAHHQSAAPLDGARPFVYAEPVGAPFEREVLVRELAERDVAEREVTALNVVPPPETARAVTLEVPPADTAQVVAAETPTTETTQAVAPKAPVRAEIVTMIPLTTAAEPAPPVAPAETVAGAPDVQGQPAEPTEHVAALPPVAEEKVALSVEPLTTATLPPPSKPPAAKVKRAKKKLAKKRQRLHTVFGQSGDNGGYPGGDARFDFLFSPNERAPNARMPNERARTID